ncbi:MAG: hypothetical protein V3U52_01215 [Thermoplasmata archaeon]
MMNSGRLDEMLQPRQLEGTYEKLKIETQLYWQLQQIYDALSDLVKRRWGLPEADVVEGMDYVSSLVAQLARRTVTLCTPRNVPVDELFAEAPELKLSPPRNHLETEPYVEFDDWFHWTLNQLGIIETALDAAQLLLTDVYAVHEWALDFIGELKHDVEREAFMKSRPHQRVRREKDG